MKGASGHPAARVAVAFSGVFLVGAVGFYLSSPPGSTAGAIAVGIVSSLIASFAFALISALLIANRAMEMQENLIGLSSSVGALQRAVPVLAQAEAHQVRAVKPKADFGEEEWLSVLREAERSLSLVGHALDKWCRTPKIKAEFCESILRLLRGGGEVRLLMLAVGARRLPDQRDKGYEKRVHRTLCVLAGVNAKLVGAERSRFAVCCLGENREMPYMAVANEHFLITAPYPAAAQSSESMPTLKLAAGSQVAKDLMADVAELIEDDETTEPDLERYLSSCPEEVPRPAEFES
jgi:hypothetical protein